ncbi:glutaminyl-peptide cyclotransferase [Skeletonema marinoi]|uniref:Glutaminyl-peptide cyclotransferase n=1 Tax=Skeletonema marinoi TaxID=267567 RepID=A0AAD9DAY4_9STRA|nr:glutaminyl-peptide cyclotransferase [Skeletonema marinoi]
MGENSNEYDLEMVDVEDPAYSSDEDDFDTTDSEYGEDSLHERTLTPNTVTDNSSAAKAGFYRTSMQRQNICFGSTVFLVVGMFIAAYFYMDISFSPSNVGIFGDELAMKGASGEVGLDADNAETQEIIDEEIIELEETGHWGENGKEVRSKIDDLIFDKDKIGEHKWVEENDWWKNNIGNMDISNMTKAELKAYKKIKKKEEHKKKKQHKEEEKQAKAAKNGKKGKPNKKKGHLEDIDDIKQKLANRHHESHGKSREKNKHAIDDAYRMKQKHNGPRPDDWSRGKNREKGNEQNDGADAEEEQEETYEAPLDNAGDTPAEEMKAEDNTEQFEDSEEVTEEADGNEEQEEITEIQKDTRNYDVDGDVDEDVPEEDANAGENNEQVEDTEGGDDEGEQEETTETNEDTSNVDGDVPAEEETNGEETNEQVVDAEEDVNEVADDEEEEEETTSDTNSDVDGDVPAEEETNGAETNEPVVDAEEVSEAELPVATISTSYTVLEQDTHDSLSFTQGISYCSDGKIYETTGLYGQSKVRRINPDTFEVEKSIDTPREFFGEGSTCFIGKDGKEYLIEITWRERRGFVYEVPSLELLHSFDYTTTAPGNQGWGITYDPNNHELIVSDGSEYLYFWDVENFEMKRRVTVTRFDGEIQDQINELEFMDGLVCYNIWHEDEIICADPWTGKSVREYDFSDIWPANQRGNSENVLNGIALGKDHVLITGKRWDRIYKVAFNDWPTLFDNDN